MDELKIGLIGGSGMGQAFAADGARRHSVDTPFGKPSDDILESELGGTPVFFLSRHGPGHTLNPSQAPYRANIFALKQLGCTHVIASGAVGSLREEFRPRDLVIADQVIDKTFKRPNTFYDRAAVHVELAEPFCRVLRQCLLDAAAAPSSAAEPPENPAGAAYKVHDRGCYVAMEGPAFSTRAESLMHRLWGGDLIGMTAMPEAKLAREAEMSYALVALVTDYDCWRQKQPLAPGVLPADPGPAEPADPAALLKEIIANLQAASENATGLIRRTIVQMTGRREELMSAPSRQSLRLAIWSEKQMIDPQEIDRLRPLWGRYFTP